MITFLQEQPLEKVNQHLPSNQNRSFNELLGCCFRLGEMRCDSCLWMVTKKMNSSPLYKSNYSLTNDLSRCVTGSSSSGQGSPGISDLLICLFRAAFLVTACPLWLRSLNEKHGGDELTADALHRPIFPRKIVCCSVSVNKLFSWRLHSYLAQYLTFL